ncbi:DUF47 domain-containing protein [Lentibacillus cibarius]|uniref:DUF47 domain-containing protein n=1 Tax=Lentibacillus cibarius TaxID=2583219 RepID=A0A5S3QSV8_9BACI|nr:DUF47 family protein [Lentibacillus cibarius]TMN23776.1 DUF47 domain-containing protein [Lentibacillus cibarius]
MFNKKPDKITAYLVDFAKHLSEATDYFLTFKVKDDNTLQEFALTMKQYETEADEKVHGILQHLNHVFITPIEREDIMQLTMNLDDLIDGMEEFTALMDIHQIYSSDKYIDQFTDYIQKCSKEISLALELFADSNLKDMEKHAIQIKDYESKCDDLYRNSMKGLFQNEANPIKVIQYKEIYETLEQIADDYEDVANIMQSIIMKNA